VRLAALFALALASFAPCSVAAQTPPVPQLPPPQHIEIPANWLVSIEAGESVDQLSNGFANWSSTYLFAKERGLYGRPTYYEYWNEDERYGFHDRQFGAGGVFFVTPKTLVGLELAESPTHNVLPSFNGALNLEQRFAQGYGAIATYTRRTYTTTNASIENLTLDRYVGIYRFSYGISFAQLSGTPGTAITQSLSATAYGERGGDLTLSGYGGRDVESTGPTTVLVMDVAGFALNGHAMVTKRLAIAYGAEAWNQGNLFTAAGLRLGLRYAF
jgi:YaiO family outer membrane protein